MEIRDADNGLDLAPRVEESAEGNEQWMVGDLVLGPPGFTVIRKDGSKSYGVISLPRFGRTPLAAPSTGPSAEKLKAWGLGTP